MVAAFASRYFCILIIFACAWSSSLSLGPLGGSPRWPKYLLDRYSLYPRSLDSLNYIPSSSLYAILHSEHFLLIYSSSDVSMFRNRAQGPLYQFGLLPLHYFFKKSLVAASHLHLHPYSNPNLQPCFLNMYNILQNLFT